MVNSVKFKHNNKQLFTRIEKYVKKKRWHHCPEFVASKCIIIFLHPSIYHLLVKPLLSLRLFKTII